MAKWNVEPETTETWNYAKDERAFAGFMVVSLESVSEKEKFFELNKHLKKFEQQIIFVVYGKQDVDIIRG